MAKLYKIELSERVWENVMMHLGQRKEQLRQLNVLWKTQIGRGEREKEAHIAIEENNVQRRVIDRHIEEIELQLEKQGSSTTSYEHLT